MPSRGQLPATKMSGLGEHAPAEVPGDDASRHVDSGLVRQGSYFAEAEETEAPVQEAVVGKVQPVENHKGRIGQTLGYGCSAWCFVSE